MLSGTKTSALLRDANQADLRVRSWRAVGWHVRDLDQWAGGEDCTMLRCLRKTYSVKAVKPLPWGLPCTLQETAVSTQLQPYATASNSGVLEYEETTSACESRENEATGIIVHGLLGSGRNWRNFSRTLANDLAQTSGRPWRFWLVDQRCHGNSTHIPGLLAPSTISASAQDLGRLLDRKLPGTVVDALMGHSLGGKVVMDLLQQRRDNPPAKQLWVLDSVVGAARSGQEEPTDVKRVLDEIEKIPLPVPSRDWLYQHLEARGFSSGFRMWMGSNLVTRQGKYWWSFDVKCAQQLYQSYQTSDYWDLINSPPAGVTINLVRAAKSDRWSEKHWGNLEAAAAASQGHVKLHILPDAGHWLHADNPEGLRQLVASNSKQL